MTIKQFIEKAIAGGWRKFPETVEVTEDVITPGCIGLRGIEKNCTLMVSIYQVILDPTAWQAVGKVEGWKKTRKEWSYREGNGPTIYLLDRAENEMHNMIDALCAGKTIEEFLKTI